MKSEDEIKQSLGLRKFMISAEGPILFSKACEIFIGEVAIRAWTNTCHGKRRTVQKADVQAALNRSDMYDFLIDIVPRIVGVVPVETTAGTGYTQGDTLSAQNNNNTADNSASESMTNSSSTYDTNSWMLQAIIRKMQQEGAVEGGGSDLYSTFTTTDVERLAAQWQQQATQELQAAENDNT